MRPCSSIHRRNRCMSSQPSLPMVQSWAEAGWTNSEAERITSVAGVHLKRLNREDARAPTVRFIFLLNCHDPTPFHTALDNEAAQLTRPGQRERFNPNHGIALPRSARKLRVPLGRALGHGTTFRGSRPNVPLPRSELASVPKTSRPFGATLRESLTGAGESVLRPHRSPKGLRASEPWGKASAWVDRALTGSPVPGCASGGPCGVARWRFVAALIGASTGLNSAWPRFSLRQNSPSSTSREPPPWRTRPPHCQDEALEDL